MPQPRKKSGRRSLSASRAPGDQKVQPASAPSTAKRSKTKQAALELPADRTAGPVNPDSMSADVIEFITAVDEYKRKRGRPFPSWSEILEVVKQLGYRKAS
jgi:hypothetical protein